MSKEVLYVFREVNPTPKRALVDNHRREVPPWPPALVPVKAGPHGDKVDRLSPCACF